MSVIDYDALLVSDDIHERIHGCINKLYKLEYVGISGQRMSCNDYIELALILRTLMCFTKNDKPTDYDIISYNRYKLFIKSHELSNLQYVDLLTSYIDQVIDMYK